ncbi:MAG: aspartate/glutamate racemase family protein [Polyangiaceae bacterium]
MPGDPELTFLHTAQVHVATFDALLHELGASEPVRHVVHPELLEQARNLGVRHPDVAQSVASRIHSLTSDGARFIVCTCSTIGGIAEAAASGECTVLRIDRPMAEQAVNSGRRILVAAALESTFEPTLELLAQVAEERGVEPEIARLSCTDAWRLFEAGDRAGYARNIARQVAEQARAGDLVVLAQASMAPAGEWFERADVTLLSSPRLGVEAALASVRERAC